MSTHCRRIQPGISGRAVTATRSRLGNYLEAPASAIFALPPKGEPHRAGFTQPGGSSDAAVAGRRIRRADHPLDRAHLITGEDGLSLSQGQITSTVRYAECAGLLKWPDGARQFIGRDVGHHPNRAGTVAPEESVTQLDTMVAADRLVTIPSRSTAPHLGDCRAWLLSWPCRPW